MCVCTYGYGEPEIKPIERFVKLESIHGVQSIWERCHYPPSKTQNFLLGFSLAQSSVSPGRSMSRKIRLLSYFFRTLNLGQFCIGCWVWVFQIRAWLLVSPLFLPLQFQCFLWRTDSAVVLVVVLVGQVFFRLLVFFTPSLHPLYLCFDHQSHMLTHCCQ